MKLIHALPAAGLLITGLTSVPKSDLPSQPAAGPAATPAPEVWTEKSVYYRDDAIELHFSLPHGANLGVIDPDGKFFYLVFPGENASGNLRPFMDSELFSQVGAITLLPASLKADPYTYGVLENQRVFTKSGTYRFILGDDLHVDDENSLTTHSIRYRQSKRPID